MAENEIKETNEELDKNAKDIIKRANAFENLTESEAKALIEKINKELDFDKLLEQVKAKYPLDGNKYVIFTNEKEQLYYENGEFFVISAVDSRKEKKKIKRKEALDLYNEYYIVNILNPLLRQKAVKEKNNPTTDIKETKEISKEEKIETKVTKKENEVKSKEKVDKVNESKENIKQVEKDIKSMQQKLKELKEKEKRLKEKRTEPKVR